MDFIYSGFVKNMARPRKDPDKHEPTHETRSMVASMYAAGIPQIRIAHHLNINIDTLAKYYRSELDLSLDKMVALLSDGVMSDALAGDKQQREFYLKHRGKWSAYKPPEEQPTVQILTALEQLNEKLKSQNESNK